MFYYILVMCTSIGNTVQCLPPQQYQTERGCQFMRQQYIAAANKAYGNLRGGDVAYGRCVKMPAVEGLRK